MIVWIVRLCRSPQHRRKGVGLAVVGLVLAGLCVAGAGVVLMSGADRDGSGTIVGNGSVQVEDLRPGDCFNESDATAGQDKTYAVDGVPCTEPHQGEAFAVFDLAGSVYPGDDQVTKQSSDECRARLPGYSPRAADDPSVEISMFMPMERAWNKGDHTVTCAVSDPNHRTGSVRG